MHSTTSRALGLVLTAATALGLAACGSDATETSSSPAASSASVEATPTETAEPTPSTTPTVLPASGNFNQALTKPGTALEIGQPAYLELVTGKEDQPESHSRAIVKVTLVEVRKGSNADFADLENAAEFKGYTPFYLESETEIVAFEGSRFAMPRVSLDPIGKGRIGSMITFNFDACKSASYDSDGEVVGRTSKPCDVAAGTDGGAVTGAEFNGNESSSDYYKKPVTWGPGASWISVPAPARPTVLVRRERTRGTPGPVCRVGPDSSPLVARPHTG